MIVSKETPIVIYGAGLTAEKFLCLYQDKYKISFFIDRNAPREFHGIPVYTLNDAIKFLKDELIVVMARNRHTESELISRLTEKGFCEYEDYIALRKLNKKLAILYGNCHFSVLEEFLNKIPEFQDEYYIDRYYVADRDKSKREPSEDELNRCDLLITQDIKSENELGVMDCFSAKNKVRHGKTIITPNLYGCNIYFPQAVELDDVMDLHVNDNAVISDEGMAIIQWM